MVDTADRCPGEAEDTDDFEDTDGCPDLDNDRDRVPDLMDQCPDVTEDRDGIEDEDGCPDLDNERDANLDRDDLCPKDAESRGAFAHVDGCPDLDRDRDGVPDPDAHCIAQPGATENHGCPVLPVDAQTRQLVVPKRIEFSLDGDRILTQSVPVLDQVRTTLRENHKLQRIRIEGHTDDSGGARKNFDLSKRRAASVARWFTEHGIAVTRLEAWGCGQTRPLVPNASDEQRSQNRRVEFHALTAEDEALAEDKCQQVKLETPARP